MQTFLILLVASLAAGFAVAAIVWPALWWLGVFECPQAVRGWFAAAPSTIALVEPLWFSSTENLQVGGRYELNPQIIQFVSVRTGASPVFDRPTPRKKSREFIYAPST